MNASEISGLQHWSFTSLFEENHDIYYVIYLKAFQSIIERTKIYPSITELEIAVKGIPVEEDNFARHCESKNSYNVQWNLECLESFSRYIVFVMYRRDF